MLTRVKRVQAGGPAPSGVRLGALKGKRQWARGPLWSRGVANKKGEMSGGGRGSCKDACFRLSDPRVTRKGRNTKAPGKISLFPT